MITISESEYNIVKAIYTLKKITIVIDNSTDKNVDLKITEQNGEIYDANGNRYDNFNLINANSKLYIDVYYNTGIQIYSSYNNTNSYLTNDKKEGYQIITEPITFTINSSDCIIEGTLITLYDGTQKKVEDLTYNDLLLVFNHETGKYDKAYSSYIIHENESKQLERIINLKFSDGTTIGIVSEHGFFNIEQNEYIFINEYNINEYIGKHFYTINNSSNVVLLVDYEIEEKVVRIFSPISEYHLNYFAEGMLTVSNFLDGLVNIFKLDDSMKYDEKSMIENINKYGLADINDFIDFADVETIKKFPYQYLLVAIGKEKTSFEELEWLYKTFIISQ